MTKPIIDMPSKGDLSETVLNPYSEAEISAVPDLEGKIEKLMEFFGTSGIQYDKALNQDKTAYPNYGYMAIPGQRDTQKWLQTVRDIYFKETQGTPRVQAIRQTTTGWNVVETFDFLNWLRFYEEGSHLKYKVAQLWYENSAPGYYLPNKQEKPISGRDIDEARDSISEDAERKRTIEKQRQKLISRLNSTEKLLCSPDGQMFAGKELESLVEAIYTLKKKIQLINKKSTSLRLYEDMIVREANVLCRRGFVKASETLYALSQNLMPIPVSPEQPEKGSGSAGGLPSMGPGMPQNPPESAPNDFSVIPKAQSPGMAQFLEGLETSKLTSPDELEVEDPAETLEVMDAADELVVEAQEIPMPLAPPSPIVEEEPLEVMEEEIPPSDSTKAKDMDSRIGEAFSGITIGDVVAKLEDLSKIFKNREIPRQLAIVDMMLDSLGLASFFQGLSEASNKAIESNNYISTRLEDIIAKLRGTMESSSIDLKKEDQQVSPEMVAFKQNLENQEDQDSSRKQTRKSLVEPLPEVPQVEIGEDLGKAAPVLTPTPAVAPVAPTAPPPAI